MYCWFESNPCHNQSFSSAWFRAVDLHSKGHRFKSFCTHYIAGKLSWCTRKSHKLLLVEFDSLTCYFYKFFLVLFLDVYQLVDSLLWEQEVKGSSPFIQTNYYITATQLIRGLSEWIIVMLLKSIVCKSTKGSNPLSSAIEGISDTTTTCTLESQIKDTAPSDAMLIRYKSKLVSNLISYGKQVVLHI